MELSQLAQAVGDRPLMVGIAPDDGEFVGTLDEIYWHPAVATRWDAHARTFAFWWAGDGGHVHVHKYLYASDEGETVRLYGDGIGIFLDDRMTDEALGILDEYVKTDEYALLREYRALDNAFDGMRSSPFPPQVPSRPYDVVVEVYLQQVDPPENGILGAWAYSDDEIAYCERPGSGAKRYVERSMTSGFKPREVIEWWLDKNDYVDRVRRGTVMAPDVHRAARRALADAIEEVRASSVKKVSLP